MTFRTEIRRLAGFAVAWVALLGASPGAPTTMYLRLPAVSAAPVVQDLTYDAIATVPAVRGTAPQLMPRDRVEATLMVATTSADPFATQSIPQRWSSLVVVETDDNDDVTRRTTFRNVTVSSVRPMRLPDGSAGEKVRFTAANVSVSGGASTVSQH
jgi:hypothetical protein